MPSLLNPRTDAALLLLGGCVGLLVSVLVSARALASDHSLSPFRRALGHFLPIAIMAVTASLMGHFEIAIGIVFGTSIAMLSSVAGFVVMSGPLESLPPAARRLIPFLPVPAILAFVLGFGGDLSWLEAALLAMLGVAVVILYRDTRSDSPAQSAAAQSPAGISPVILVVALLLAAAASYAAVRGAYRLSAVDYRYTPRVISATLLSVVLALPMVSTGSPLAAAGRTSVPITAQAGVVLLNLCFLFPAVIVIGRVSVEVAYEKATQAHRLAPAKPASVPATSRTTAPAHPDIEPDDEPAPPERATLTFPRAAWRIDAVFLVILALVFAAIASNQLPLNPFVGGLLIVGYCAYMLSVLIGASRSL